MSQTIAEELAFIDLGDARLNRRARQVLTRFLESPSLSPTAATHGWAETLGAYRLLDHPECTLEAILQAHQQPVLQRVRAHSRILLIQDTTELDYSSKKKQIGRGPLAAADRQGYFLHTQWAVSEDRLPLGSWGWQINARDPEVGIAPERKKKPIEEKESYRWLEGDRAACALAEQAPGVEVISCADREGDVYEVFAEWQQRLQDGLAAAEWLIRCNQNRALLPSDDELTAKAAPLIEEVRQTPAVGGVWFEIKTKEQFKKVKGNTHLMIAHFGGYIGRRSDGPPGPEVMWRGMQSLRCFALAWRSFGQNSS